MRAQRRGGWRKGFTLIELLVVMGIVAILAALTFPMFGRMRQSGNEIKTLSNMRQMGTALLAYAGENNYNLPARVSPTQESEGKADKWPKVLQPYVQNLEVYSSPLPGYGGESYKVVNPQDYFSNDRNFTSYIYNGCNDMVPLDSGEPYPRLNLVAAPSSTILLGIPVPKSGQFYMDFSEGLGNNNSVLNKSAFPDGTTYIFCDGSARKLVASPKLTAAANKLPPETSGDYTDWLWLFNKDKADVIQ